MAERYAARGSVLVLELVPLVPAICACRNAVKGSVEDDVLSCPCRISARELVLLDVPEDWFACSSSNVVRRSLARAGFPPVSPLVAVVVVVLALVLFVAVDALVSASVFVCADANCCCCKRSCCKAVLLLVLLLTAKDIEILLSQKAPWSAALVPEKQEPCLTHRE